MPNTARGESEFLAGTQRHVMRLTLGALAEIENGLGVSSLSAAAAAIQGVGAKLAQVTLQQCRDAADAVLGTATAADARAAALAVLG